MTLKNKFFNWQHGVKRYKGKGCNNVGVRTGEITKYDWSKPITFVTKPFDVDYWFGKSLRIKSPLLKRLGKKVDTKYQWITDKDMRHIRPLHKGVYDTKDDGKCFGL
jgi:hypothetical protein